MTEAQRDAAAAKQVASKRYDPTALIGVIVALGPDIAQELTDSELGLAPRTVRVIRIVGLLIAAYGRSLLLRKPPMQDAALPVSGAADVALPSAEQVLR